MERYLEKITASVQALKSIAAFSTTTGVSGSAVVDMKLYGHVIARAHIGKLPDNKGALSASTLTIYECATTDVSGSPVTASIVTSTLISNSAETLLETELRVDQLSPSMRYVYAHFNTNTKTDVSVIIERAEPRYEPV